MIKNDLSISIYIYNPYLEVFRAGLDGALSNCVMEGVSAHSTGLQWDNVKGPFQPCEFYDSVIFKSFV